MKIGKMNVFDNLYLTKGSSPYKCTWSQCERTWKYNRVKRKGLLMWRSVWMIV